MGIIIEFFVWLGKLIGGFFSKLTSIPGLIVSALSAFAVAVVSLFGDNQISQTLSTVLDNLSTQILSLVNTISPQSDMGKEVLSLFAVDQLFSAFTLTFSTTVGAMAFIFFGIIIICIGFILTTLMCRMILKVLQLFSGGFVDA